MHFFVARLLSITANYVRHVRNLRPMNRLIYYAANKIKLRQCTERVSTQDTTVA